MRPTRFLDPLYGVIEFDEREKELLFSPEFQRLRYVRLCNINSLFISGASEPSRFEHCVGVYYLAREWARRNNLSVEDAFTFKSAALLHDLQTGPFGHSFQYVLEDNRFDETFEHANLSHGSAANFHQRTTRGAAFAGKQFTVPFLLASNQDRVWEAVRGGGRFGPLISGTLDLDNLDNVVRLAFHVGLCNDTDRKLPTTFVDLVGIENDTIKTNNEGRRLIQRWLDIRADLYRYLLLDRGEFSAKAMLTLAVEIAIDHNILYPDHWTLTDDELIAHIENHAVGDAQQASRIVKRLRVGHLFEEVGVWTTQDIRIYDLLSSSKSKRQFEKEVESFASVQGGEKLNLCLHTILDHRKTRRAVTYLNSDTQIKEVAGADSADMHLGLFFTNDRSVSVSERTVAKYKHAFSQAIAKYTQHEVALADDPLFPVEAAPTQFPLI